MAMGIYDDSFKFDFNYKKMKKPLFAILFIIFIVIILIILLSLPNLFKPKTLELNLSKSEIRKNEQTELFVKITNNTKGDIRNIKVEVEAIDRKSISVIPSKIFIDVIESNGSRTPKFIVNPIGDVMIGSYAIKAKVDMNGKIYEDQIMLKIVK